MEQREPSEETYSPWTVVNLVFNHLAAQGLHPTLGESGDPAQHAAALLRALGVPPAHVTGTPLTPEVRDELAELRRIMLDEP